MDTSGLATSYLEGIGRVSAQELRAIGVYFVSDLVRAHAHQISAATGGRISDDMGRRWRAMALLLEINGMDNQLVEAMVDAGIYTTEQVQLRSESELADVFTQARDNGKIPGIPDTGKIVEILLDATRLHFTGSLTGTILDSDDEPVAGADVSIARQDLVTDQRGRFRALRIPLGFNHELSITAEGYDRFVQNNPPLIADDAVIGVEILTLNAAPQNASTPEPVTLCEYNGDTLPTLSHHTVTTRAMGSLSTLREGDVLVLHRFYAGGDEAQLSSKFLQYENGRFITLNWRVPLDSLPAGATLKKVFRYRHGRFSLLRMSANQLKHYLALQRARKSLSGSAPPVTPMEIDITAALFSDALSEQL